MITLDFPGITSGTNAQAYLKEKNDMFGILKDLALTFIVIILNHWVYGVEDDITYGALVNFLISNQTSLLGTSALFLVLLLGCSALFEALEMRSGWQGCPLLSIYKRSR